MIGRMSVEEEMVVDCLVDALKYPDGGAHRAAARQLWMRTRPSFLRARTERLVEGFELREDGHLLRAIGRTDTVEARRLVDALLAKGSDVPEDIQARCGNKAIEKKILRQFREETDPRKKGELALKLGYIGTPACVVALAREARNPMVVENRRQKYSVRYMVFQGLGLAFPDEALFNRELGLATRWVFLSPVEGKKEQAEDYIQRIETWCEQWLGIEWGDRPRPPFQLIAPVVQF